MNSFPNFLWCSKNCNSIYHKMNLYLIEGVMLKYEILLGVLFLSGNFCKYFLSKIQTCVKHIGYTICFLFQTP